jgi:GH24 family phage-related lysozyme (muramidase)
MKIKNFRDFNEEKKVSEILDWIDNSINESVDLKSIWYKTIDKIKNLSKESKTKILKKILIPMLAFNTGFVVSDLVDKSPIDDETKQIALSIVENPEQVEVVDSSNWKNGAEFTLSDDGWNHIKEEEKLRLKAYSIGDGMITVGWGHAEPEIESKYHVGQQISIGEAEVLLKNDLNNTADGVRKIFKDWKEKGIDVKITQDMFDALVSIAFNSGVGGLRKSELIQDIKKQDFVSAGEKIKSFRVSKRFPGLEKRRDKESKMFLASL